MVAFEAPNLQLFYTLSVWQQIESDSTDICVHFRSLSRSVGMLLDKRFAYTPTEILDEIRAEIDATEADHPGLLPSRELPKVDDQDSVKPVVAAAFLGRALAALEAEFEDGAITAIVGPTLAFPFMRNLELRAIVERDYPELLAVFGTSAKKSSLVLAGSIIEAVLLDFVAQNATLAVASPVAPREPDPMKWTLEQLINVAADLKPSLAPITTMSHGVRQYRNLVHPAAELRSQLKVEIEEARVAITLVSILHRELS